MTALLWTVRPADSTRTHARAVGDRLAITAARALGAIRAAVERHDPRLRPELVTDSDHELHHSVSHSGRVTACLVGRGPVGLDVEKQGLDRERRLRPVSLAGFLTEAERAELTADPTALAHIFTRKEAWLKYTGDGLAAGLGSVDVDQVLREHPDVDLDTFMLTDAVAGIAVCSAWFPAGMRPDPVRTEVSP